MKAITVIISIVLVTLIGSGMNLENSEVNTENEINYNEYTKITDAKVYSNGTSLTEFVFYDNKLYGRAFSEIDYGGNPVGPIGVIDTLIDSEYIPKKNGETNVEKIYNALVDSVSERRLILLTEEGAVPFERVYIQDNNNETIDFVENIDQKNNNEEKDKKYIINEISYANTGVDYSDKEVLKSESDLIILGKIDEITEVSNYVKNRDYYSATRTFANIEVLDVLEIKENLKIEDNAIKDKLTNDNQKIKIAFYGGTLPYIEYEKSLTPSEKEKNNTLKIFNQEGRTKMNTYVRTKSQNQLDIEEGKIYLLYLYYSEAYGMFVPVDADEGVKEYDATLKQVKNHITGESKLIDEVI